MKKSDFKQQIRNEARRPGGVTRFNASTQKSAADAIEQGRRQLLRSCNEGGDSAAKQYKSELMYLLNNYMPQYDMRIEALIDAWRTSHDPSYEPGIRVRLRQARIEFMRKSNPF